MRLTTSCTATAGESPAPAGERARARDPASAAIFPDITEIALTAPAPRRPCRMNSPEGSDAAARRIAGSADRPITSRRQPRSPDPARELHLTAESAQTRWPHLRLAKGGCAGPREPRFAFARARAWRHTPLAAFVRLRKHSSPGSASASWLLCSIARSVAAETALLCLQPTRTWLALGPVGRQRVRAVCSTRVAALRCEHLVRRRPDGLLDAGAAGTGVAPQAGRGIPGTASCRGWVGVSLIEPQRRDQDVALPHVTNQIPIATTIGPFDRLCRLWISVLLSRVVAAARPYHRPRPRTGTMTLKLSAGGG